MKKNLLLLVSLTVMVILSTFGCAEKKEVEDVFYKNEELGFLVQLPESWEGYSVVVEEWDGGAEKGTLISIRHPLWTKEKARQDIPIMIFNMEQWSALLREELSIGAAPMIPKELGRNENYLFALPARYNDAFLGGYEEVEDIIENNSFMLIGEERPTISESEEIIKEKANLVLQAIKDKDTKTWSDYVHPKKGVRLTPYTYVSLENDLLFGRDEIKEFFLSEELYIWGSFDGSGFDIEMTASEYYERFIYSKDFLNAEKVGYNKVLSNGNMLENQFQVYDYPIIVEYYFSGFEPEYGGLDWESIRLVFEEYEGVWYLAGIIHNQWTI